MAKKQTKNQAEATAESQDVSIVTTKQLANAISKEVSRQLKESINADAARVTSDLGGLAGDLLVRVEQTLFAKSEQLIEKLGKEFQEIAEKVLRCAQRCYDKTKELAEKTSKEFLDAMLKAKNNMDNGMQKASVETLTSIIGEEIARHEFETLIRDELRAAVKLALAGK